MSIAMNKVETTGKSLPQKREGAKEHDAMKI
jgi:hypothetical protein